MTAPFFALPSVTSTVAFAALRELLGTLEARGIGEVATIGPNQVLLILPFAAHGVFVPTVAGNPSHRLHWHSSRGIARPLRTQWIRL